MWSCNESLIEIEGAEHIYIKNCVDYELNEFIIDDKDSYLDLFTRPHPTEYCQNFQIPEIDFENRTLLGYYSTIQGCSLKYRRTLMADPDEKEYIYTIYYRNEGDCEKTISYMHWMSIPQLPSDYSVRFELKAE